LILHHDGSRSESHSDQSPVNGFVRFTKRKLPFLLHYRYAFQATKLGMKGKFRTYTTRERALHSLH
jgi:hypothetical protein